ncbi:MAG: DNA-directed RNA polymerase subunit omega [Acidobacteria bacterium]|nr:DNA-directed RNA polymerase subunit omega [Acidobacteriota bacterium]
MNDTHNDTHDSVNDGDTEPIAPTRPVAMPRIPEQRMKPITSRFLFVEVSSRRAKQLRRGALPRLEALRPDPETGHRPEVTSRLERVAMEEVEQGLIVYEHEDTSPEETTS